MAFFTTPNGLKLHVDDAGGTGLPVIFQHGLCGDARQTAEVFPADSRFRRITVEARGHGASEAGDLSQFSIAAFAEDVAALIMAQNLGPVCVGGISMGAAMALRLAVTRPDLVRGLILVRPAWVAQAAPANMQPNAEVGALLARMPQADAFAAFMAGETAALDLLAARGVAAGMVLRVETPVERVAPYLPRLRFLTLLGTAIGVKGQGLSDTACPRLGRARTLIAASGAPHRIVLAADGGIREHTVPMLRQAGAETVVLGSLAFNAPDLSGRMKWLHAL